MPKRKLTGVVTSNKMQKTIVVQVERVKMHPKYKRRYKVHKKYKVHVEDGIYKIGDAVVIEECRPVSKDKKWKVVRKISDNAKETEPIEEKENQ